MASLPNVSPFLFSMLLLLISCSEAKEYLVGDSEHSWKVPLPSPDSLNQWADSQQFMVGDSLVFKYDKKTESVHLVNETDYIMCNTVGKHKVYKDGDSKVSLTSSEPIHIISGNKDHCLMGLKFAVVVSGKHHGGGNSSHSPAPSPSPLPSLSTNHGVVGSSGGGFISIMSLGVSLLIMVVFFIV